MTSFREAAAVLWGDAGAYVHDAYSELRPLYPELPPAVPIVIGITAYGKCMGLTRAGFAHGPRISVASNAFSRGRGFVADVMAHEMAHCWLIVTGRQAGHDGADWYEAVRRLSPAVLGHEVDVRRGSGGGRTSVRVPNPDYVPGGEAPKTVVRKRRVEGDTQHGDVARWPHAFRAAGHDWGEPVTDCPSY